MVAVAVAAAAAAASRGAVAGAVADRSRRRADSSGSGRSFGQAGRSSGADRSFSAPSRSFGGSGISRMLHHRATSACSPREQFVAARPFVRLPISAPASRGSAATRARAAAWATDYSPSRRMSPGSFDRSGSQGFSDASRSGRSSSRDLGLARPDRTSVDRSPFAGESIARQGSTGSRGLEGMRSPGDRSGVFGDSSSRSGLSGRDSIARQIARPSTSDRASRSSLADASSGRDSISRDSMNRGSTNRRSTDQAPMGRGISRGPITDGAGGDLRGGDSVARQTGAAGHNRAQHHPSGRTACRELR